MINHYITKTIHSKCKSNFFIYLFTNYANLYYLLVLQGHSNNAKYSFFNKYVIDFYLAYFCCKINDSYAI